MRFTIYIDESGESGISRVRDGPKPGASPYFVVGAAVLQPATEIHARKVIEDFRNEIGKTSWKHATELAHFEKVYFSRLLSALPARFFAVVSNKSTLGEYKKRIDDDAQKFYNKCILYLLERICTYLGAQGATEEDLRVVLEERNHDYDRMLRYLTKVKSNPMYPESRSLSILNPFSISTRRKGEDSLLEIADFISHAVYQCTNRTEKNFYIPEPRYFSEISSRFAADKDGNVLGTGLKCIHKLSQLELDEDIQKLFRQAKAPMPRR